MKKRLFTFLLSTTAFITASLSLSGCNFRQGNVKAYADDDKYVVSEVREALPYYSLSYEIMGGNDVMPVGGYYGLYKTQASLNGNLYPNWISDKYFKLSNEMGLNMIVYVNDRVEADMDSYKKWYQLGEKYHIGIFANSVDFELKVGTRTVDMVGTGVVEAPTEEWLLAKLKQASCDFSYKSFLGLWAMDEAYANHQLVNLVDITNMFYECDEIPEGIDLYSNTLGYWEGLNNVSNTFIGGGWTFDEYMFTGKKGTNKDGTTYEIPPYLDAGFKMLSTTQYPFIQLETDYQKISDWFQKMSKLIKISNEQKIPYWRMMQAGSEFGATNLKSHYPLEGQWMLDYNAALAFGCKGMQFYEFCADLWHNSLYDGNYDYGKNGIYGADGKINEWWYYAKNANTHLQAIDHILMNSANVGILPHGNQAKELIGELNGELITEKGWRELKSVGGDDCFIGCFDYKGKTALYVVNSSCEEKANITLNFNNKYRYDVVQRAQSVSVVGTSIPLTLAPGEGVMITLY